MSSDTARAELVEPPAEPAVMCDNNRGAGQESKSENLRATTVKFQHTDSGRSLAQIASTFGALLALWGAMYVSLSVTYWLTLVLSLPAAAFVVRLFIIQHDCGHRAFFQTRWLNDLVGRLCSVLTLTPYQHWRRQHSGHHAHWNNLDRRDRGVDIYSTCLTTAEYDALSPTRRILYRAVRHPLVAFVLVPPLVFLVLYRLPFDTPASWRAERRSVHLTNLALLATIVTLGTMVGFPQFAMVQLPITVAASIMGVWIFSVQHKFDVAAWYRNEGWNSNAASLHGSSYLRLPGWMQWWTGSIGLHHVHHLNPRIPNYRLEECRKAVPMLRAVAPLTARQAFRACRLWLWDERNQRMVRFSSDRTGRSAE